MVYFPCIRENKEYESPIGKYRLAKGMTIDDLSREVKTSPGVLAGLQNGMISPVYLTSSNGYKKGEIKPWVKKTCEVLGIEFKDLFPRYACDIERSLGDKNYFSSYFTKNQLVDIQLGDRGVDLRELENKIFAEQIFNNCELNSIQREVLFRRFWIDSTLDEVGGYFGLHRERIRQIESKAFRKLRRYLSIECRALSRRCSIKPSKKNKLANIFYY